MMPSLSLAEFMRGRCDFDVTDDFHRLIISYWPEVFVSLPLDYVSLNPNVWQETRMCVAVFHFFFLSPLLPPNPPAFPSLTIKHIQVLTSSGGDYAWWTSEVFIWAFWEDYTSTDGNTGAAKSIANRVRTILERWQRKVPLLNVWSGQCGAFSSQCCHSVLMLQIRLFEQIS